MSRSPRRAPRSSWSTDGAPRPRTSSASPGPLARPGVAFLAPQAADHSWYPQRFLAPLADNEPWLSSALGKLASLRSVIAAFGIPDERIVWLGFSQGACLASEFVARNPRRWGGLVAAVGGRIGPQGTQFGTPSEAAGDLARTPVYLGCGDSDPHIPWHRVEETAAAFTHQNGEVTLRRYADFPHSVHPEAITFARRLLDELAAPEPVRGATRRGG